LNELPTKPPLLLLVDGWLSWCLFEGNPWLAPYKVCHFDSLCCLPTFYTLLNSILTWIGAKSLLPCDGIIIYGLWQLPHAYSRHLHFYKPWVHMWSQPIHGMYPIPLPFIGSICPHGIGKIGGITYWVSFLGLNGFFLPFRCQLYLPCFSLSFS
jgi:hypothetical protein